MKYALVALLLVISCLQFSLTSAQSCTLAQAEAIRDDRTQEILMRTNNIVLTAEKQIDDLKANLTTLTTEATNNQEAAIDDIQTRLDNAQQAAQENQLPSANCLAALQFQIDSLSDQSNIKLEKCSLHSQEKELQLRNKLASVQQKVTSTRMKAVFAMHKCAVQKSATLTCLTLNANCASEQSKLLKKTDSLVTKFSSNANDVSEDFNNCASHTQQSLSQNIGYIRQQIFACQVQFPSLPVPVALDQSKESAETVEAQPETAESTNQQEPEQTASAPQPEEEGSGVPEAVGNEASEQNDQADQTAENGLEQQTEQNVGSQQAVAESEVQNSASQNENNLSEQQESNPEQSSQQNNEVVE